MAVLISLHPRSISIADADIMEALKEANEIIGKLELALVHSRASLCEWKDIRHQLEWHIKEHINPAQEITPLVDNSGITDELVCKARDHHWRYPYDDKVFIRAENIYERLSIYDCARSEATKVIFNEAKVGDSIKRGTVFYRRIF